MTSALTPRCKFPSTRKKKKNAAVSQSTDCASFFVSCTSVPHSNTRAFQTSHLKSVVPGRLGRFVDNLSVLEVGPFESLKIDGDGKHG